MKLLLTGSNGLLGQKIIDIVVQHPHITLIATAKGVSRYSSTDKFIYEEADLSNSEQLVALFLKHQPDVVIHGGAMTQVDVCEDEREMCDKINVDAVKVLIALCEAYEAHLIHVSTDFIFDGTKPDGYYAENDTPNPVNYYGLSKLKAEEAIQKSSIKWTIIRTILLYGVVYGLSRSNIVLWVKNSLEQGKKITVVADQSRCPTLAEDLAAACVSAAIKKAEGIYHVCGPEKMNMFELAHRVATFWKLDASLISAINSETLNQRAKRPPQTAFDLTKTRHDLDYNPHSLEEGFAVLEEQLKAWG